MSSDLTMVISN